jgi:hypothetical protein
MIWRFLNNRLPKFQSLVPVYAVIVFMVYSWTIYIYIRFLPYWLRFLNVSEILAIFSYTMLSDFLESLSVVLFLLVFCTLLPAAFLRNAFEVRGTVMVVCLLGAIIVYMDGYAENRTPSLLSYILWSLAILAAALFLSFLAAKIRFVIPAVEWLSTNMTIFLYIYIPLTILSLLNVIFRNL